MSKVKTAWFCQECGAKSLKWIGKCPSCGQWNTYVEEVIQAQVGSSTTIRKSVNNVVPVPVSDISVTNQSRITTVDNEFNRVLGGGMVPGSVILLGGEPGIGKSTLLLQLALKSPRIKTLYVSGEESELQIKMRAERTGETGSECLVLTETNTDNILYHCKETSPDLIVVDSIQTLQSNKIDSVPGSVGQIRQSTAELQHFVKSKGIPLLLIGHITKEGQIAGPKVLEHMVDVVLLFEGDRNYGFRLLRPIKNRFGSTSELGIYEMKSSGLNAVANPSAMLISPHDDRYSGTAIAVTTEGNRPLLVEVQALVSSAVYGTPQRASTGFDLRRLNMLLAVLEKRCGFRLGAKDVFLNITGGIRLSDPATDLAVVTAILSSSEDITIGTDVCFAGEIGLTGEIRPVPGIEERIAEAAKIGFAKLCLSKYNLKGVRNVSGIKLIPAASVEELVTQLFG